MRPNTGLAVNYPNTIVVLLNAGNQKVYSRDDIIPAGGERCFLLLQKADADAGKLVSW